MLLWVGTEVFKSGLLKKIAPKDLRTRNVVPCVCLDGVT